MVWRFGIFEADWSSCSQLQLGLWDMGKDQSKKLRFSHLFWVWSQWATLITLSVHSMVRAQTFRPDLLATGAKHQNKMHICQYQQCASISIQFTKKDGRKRKGTKNELHYSPLTVRKTAVWLYGFTLWFPKLHTLMGYSKSRELLELSADWQNCWEASSAMEKENGVFSARCGAGRGAKLLRAQNDWCGAGKHIINWCCYAKNA